MVLKRVMDFFHVHRQYAATNGGAAVLDHHQSRCDAVGAFHKWS